VKLDAIVLLGCRVGQLGQHSRPAQQRAERAARAFHEGAAPVILVSGGRRWEGISEAEALGLTLEGLGVPRSAILREFSSLSTCENARFASKILRARGASEIGLVTNDWHMPRALCCFEREGFRALAIPAASEPVPLSVALLRRSREQLSFWVDSLVTWGSA
jgi:uncharacterized SAM-binding protein YcdF (DUF218 family)